MKPTLLSVTSLLFLLIVYQFLTKLNDTNNITHSQQLQNNPDLNLLDKKSIIQRNVYNQLIENIINMSRYIINNLDQNNNKLYDGFSFQKQRNFNIKKLFLQINNNWLRKSFQIFFYNVNQTREIRSLIYRKRKNIQFRILQIKINQTKIRIITRNVIKQKILQTFNESIQTQSNNIIEYRQKILSFANRRMLNTNNTSSQTNNTEIKLMANITCPIGQILDTNNICRIIPLNVDSNCQKIDFQHICIACKTNFNLIDFKCQPVIPNCKIFNEDNLCTQCLTGILNKYTFCQDKNCLISQLQICLQCVSSYYLSNNTCLKDFIPNCKQYKDTNCIQCISNYILYAKICIQIDNPCQAYDTTSQLCAICIPNFKLNSNSICIDINCNISLGKNCQTCNSGFYLLNQQCFIIPLPNCMIYQNNFCIKCQQRYYSQDNLTCIPVNNYCDKYNISNGNCLSCKANRLLKGIYCLDINCKLNIQGVCLMCSKFFYLDADGQNCFQIPISNCINYMNGTCFICNSNYVLNQGKCIQTSINNNNQTLPANTTKNQKNSKSYERFQSSKIILSAIFAIALLFF